MKEFKGCIIPDGFDENIETIKAYAETGTICNYKHCGFVPDSYCEENCKNDKCILACKHRRILREYLATLDNTKHKVKTKQNMPIPRFKIGGIMPLEYDYNVLASFIDNKKIHYVIKQYDSFSIFTEDDLLEDINNLCKDLHRTGEQLKKSVIENQVKIDALEKLLEGTK